MKKALLQFDGVALSRKQLQAVKGGYHVYCTITSTAGGGCVDQSGNVNGSNHTDALQNAVNYVRNLNLNSNCHYNYNCPIQ